MNKKHKERNNDKVTQDSAQSILSPRISPLKPIIIFINQNN